MVVYSSLVIVNFSPFFCITSAVPSSLNFISAVSCMKKSNKEICQQYISGDLVNSAFNVLFACEDKSSDEFNLSGGNVDNFNESDMESAANELLDNQELTKLDLPAGVEIEVKL